MCHNKVFDFNNMLSNPMADLRESDLGQVPRVKKKKKILNSVFKFRFVASLVFFDVSLTTKTFFMHCLLLFLSISFNSFFLFSTNERFYKQTNQITKHHHNFLSISISSSPTHGWPCCCSLKKKRKKRRKKNVLWRGEKGEKEQKKKKKKN
jgi:hypothetical protein